MIKVLTLAMMVLAIAADSTAFARSGATTFAPGHNPGFVRHESRHGASSFTPRQLFLQHNPKVCTSTHGVSGCAPGRRFR
jgi:hypothetical protein